MGKLRVDIEKHNAQVAREKGARDAALGKRAKAVAEGHLGPVLKRWINADVVPIASLMRQVAEAYLAGDIRGVAKLLDTPASELTEKERPMVPFMEWLLRGKSPGRAEDTTYAEDIALSFMASLISALASGKDGVSLSTALSGASMAVRNTVEGQFIVSIQGAKAMQAIRERQPELWKQKKSLGRIAAQLRSQIKPEFLREAREEIVIPTRGNRKVFQVLDYKGDARRIELTRTPDAIDWQIMDLCWHPDGDPSDSRHRSLWLAFAGMLLAAAQRVGGWFDVVMGPKKKRKYQATRLLVLSEKAHYAIKADIDKWVQMGFSSQPMIVAPEDGDYLSVKHRKVNGQRPAKGLLTNPDETTAWEGAKVLAETPWQVNPEALAYWRGLGEGGVERSSALDLTDTMRLAEHRRLAAEPEFFLPVSMDFRGRMYYRTPWVTPQSGDLGKSLLMFPSVADHGVWLDEEEQAQWLKAIITHMSGLWGNKVDKAPLAVRYEWWKEWSAHPSFTMAEKPHTLLAHWELMVRERTDSIPIQIDGTCNGLQHLAALTRDEEAAQHVNLARSSVLSAPADIYGVVAQQVTWRISCMDAPWVLRMRAAGLDINRKLCKGPVMVLPYGGTREAVRISVRGAVLDQLSEEIMRLGTSPWHEMEEDGYGAFKERDLKDHPGFNSDCQQLALLVWESIAPVIPRPMAFMSSLQGIGAAIGERGLAWRVGLNSGSPLWVVQAKSKAQRKQVTMKGFHLPEAVRRVTLMANSNEVDPKAHKTGIVANFIHSLDAAHLSLACVIFRAKGGGCVGAVHDCVLVRPSEAALMGRCLREAFVQLHAEDPLAQPVRLMVDKDHWEEYPSWYALAEVLGVTFPDRGEFNLEEVYDSAWFFS